MRLPHVCRELIKELVAASPPVNRTKGSAALFPGALEGDMGKGVQGSAPCSILCFFM